MVTFVIITGILLVFAFKICCISIEKLLYSELFSGSFLVTILFPEISVSLRDKFLFY